MYGGGQVILFVVSGDDNVITFRLEGGGQAKFGK